MRSIVFLFLVLCLFANAQATPVVHYDFAYKNVPYTTWDYEDVSGTGNNGTEGGTWYHVDGRTAQYADLWEESWDGRSGVYADSTKLSL